MSTRAIKVGEEVIHEFNKRRRDIDRKRRKKSIGPVIRYIARKPQTWYTIIKYLLIKASLSEVERAFSAAFNCKSKAIVIADPGFGMDMDLPEDYEKLETLVRKTKLKQQ